ncbi:MAG: hypothetical protein ACKV2V_08015 [Blastocatellia bacterium]
MNKRISVLVFLSALAVRLLTGWRVLLDPVGALCPDAPWLKSCATTSETK